MVETPWTWYDDLTDDDWKELIAKPDDIDLDFDLNDDRPNVCSRTGRTIIYDKQTGKPLDAETLIPIDNYIDFTKKSIY